MAQRSPDDIKMDPATIYREEIVTDRKVGTIRMMTPLKTDGGTAWESVSDKQLKGSVELRAADRGITRGSVTEPFGEGMPPPRTVGKRPATEALEAAVRDGAPVLSPAKETKVIQTAAIRKRLGMLGVPPP